MKNKWDTIPGSEKTWLKICGLTILVFFIYAVLATGWVHAQTEVLPPKISNKANRVLYLKDLGVPGDSTDVTTALRTVFNSASGATVYFDTNRTYFVTDSLRIPVNCEVNMKGSKLCLEMGGAKAPLTMMSGSSIRNGIIDVDSLTAYSATGDYGSGIRVGQYIYNGTITEFNKITIENMVVSTEKNGGKAINVMGQVKNVNIRNINIATTDSMGTGIQCHWGMDTSTTDTLTYIPTNILIENIHMDSFTRNSADAIYLSGVQNVTVRNVVIETPNRGIVVYGGDYGIPHADPTYFNDSATAEGSGISLENIHITGVRTNGIRVDGSHSAIAGIDDKLKVKIDGCEIIGSDTTNTATGILLTHVDGVVITRCDISKVQLGVANGDNAYGVKVKDCEIHHNNHHGIQLTDDAANAPDRWLIEGSYFHNNSLGADDSNTFAGVYMHVSYHTTVMNCFFGDSTVAQGAETQRFGISQSASAGDGLFIGNHCFNAGDQAFNVRTDHNLCLYNTATTGMTTYAGVASYPDDIKVDTAGDGTNVVQTRNTIIQEGLNITLSMDNDTVTISGPASAGTADSMGIDTDGDGTVDNYLYSTVGGAFHLKEGSDITLTVTGDTVTIAGPASAGTADSIGIDTDGDLVINTYIYATGGPIGTISEKTGMIITTNNDTVYFATTLGTTITTDEVTDSTLTGADISSASNLNVARINTSDSIVINGGTSVKKLAFRYTDPSGNQNRWQLAPYTDSKFIIQSDSASNFMVFDARNDRIGILDLTPSYTLDVTGNGQFTTDLIIGDDMSADSGYFRVITAGGQNIDNDTSIASEGEAKDFIGGVIDTITTDTIPVADKAVLSDSTKAIDTTNIGFTTYLANHGGVGTVTNTILGDTLNRYFDTVHVNDSLALLRVEMRTVDTLYGDANSFSFYRNDTLFKYVGGQFSYEYYDGTTIVYEVTGAGLSYVDSAGKITDGVVDEADLYATNAATDNYLLSFDDATGGFTWVLAGTGTVTDGILTDTLNRYLDTASIHDSLNIIRGELGPFIDSTSLDTIETAHKAVLSDSTKAIDTTNTGFTTYLANHGGVGTVTNTILTDTLDSYLDTASVKDSLDIIRGDISDSIAIFIDSAAIHDSLDIVRGEAVLDANLTDSLNSYLDTASIHDSLDVVRGDISDSIAILIDSASIHDSLDIVRGEISDSIAIFIDSASIHDSLDILRGEVRDTIDVITDLDSGNVSADGLSMTDINWTYEWVYLIQVHGFDRALSDSIYLYDNVQYGDTLILLKDSAGNITANDQDTVRIAGYVPYACTIDSLEVMYMTGAELVDVYFNGPTLTTPSNLCDSNYWTSATDLTSAAWDTAQYTFTNDVAAVAGDRFSFKYIVNYGADNERLRIAWIRMRTKR